MRLPFDWRSPFGYLIAVTLTVFVAIYEMCLYANLSSLGIGCFLFSTSSTRKLQDSLYTVNERARFEEGRTRTTKQITEFIEWYSIMKQLSRKNNELNIENFIDQNLTSFHSSD